MSASTWYRATLLATVAGGVLAAGSANAAAPAPPLWPRDFSISARQPEALALPLTAPGPVNVTVRSQGAPLVATLVRPAGTIAVQQGGTNELHLTYVATPDDLRASPIWRVALAVQSGTDPRAVVNGTVNVQAAPADPAAVNAYLAQRQGRRAPPPGPVTFASAPPASPQVTATLQAFEQGRLARRAAVFEAIRPRYEQARAGTAVATRAVAGLVAKPALQPRPMPPPGGVVVPPTAPPPSNTPPPPTAAIGSMSVAQGEPLDPVEVDGAAFGATGGEVHFVTGPATTDDHKAVVTQWGDGRIFTAVPDIAGIAAPYNGHVYVVRADGTTSPGVPFRFVPATDMLVLPLPPSNPLDTHIGATNDNCQRFFPSGWWQPVYPPNPSVAPCDADAFVSAFGINSDDTFFANMTLQHNWVVDHVDVLPLSPDTNGGAYLVDWRPGTASPYVKIHMYCYGFNGFQYTFNVYIRGPHGVPYQ
jgi:hypothetical protein